METAITGINFENKSTENKSNNEVFGKSVGIMSRVFGCWHRRMSRPVTTKNTTYRFCPSCGIRRAYDIKEFKFKGKFYYPKNNKELHHV